MSREVDEEGELFTIDTSKLIEEAQRLRKAREATRQITTEQKLSAGRSPLADNSLYATNARPKTFFDSEGQTRLGAIKGASNIKFIQDLERKQRDAERIINEIKKKQEEFEKKLFSNVQSLSQNFQGNFNIPPILQQRLGRVAGALPYVGVAAVAMGILYEEIQKEFERGGTLSTKLKLPKQAVSITEVEEDNSYRAGTKYITSDMRIIQKAPQSSNTAGIREEHIRYTMDSLGR